MQATSLAEAVPPPLHSKPLAPQLRSGIGLPSGLPSTSRPEMPNDDELIGYLSHDDLYPKRLKSNHIGSNIKKRTIGTTCTPT